MTILTKREVWRRAPIVAAYKRTPDLTAEEIANVRRALQVARRRFGSWAAAAQAMGLTLKSMETAAEKRRKPSVALALRVARAVGVPLEEILSGAWPKPGACPMCGRC